MNHTVTYIDVSGVEMYYRNNSTGNPTKIHFTKDDGSTYCGFEHWAAENVMGESSIMEEECCKTCLKQHKKNKQI